MILQDRKSKIGLAVFTTVTQNTHKIYYTRTPTTSLGNRSLTSPSQPHRTTIKYAVYCSQNTVPSVTLFGRWECLKSEIQGAKQSTAFLARCWFFFSTLLACGPHFQLLATSPGGMRLFLATWAGMAVKILIWLLKFLDSGFLKGSQLGPHPPLPKSAYIFDQFLLLFYNSF